MELGNKMKALIVMMLVAVSGVAGATMYDMNNETNVTGNDTNITMPVNNDTPVQVNDTPTQTVKTEPVSSTPNEPKTIQKPKTSSPKVTTQTEPEIKTYTEYQWKCSECGHIAPWSSGEPPACWKCGKHQTYVKIAERQHPYG